MISKCLLTSLGHMHTTVEGLKNS